MWSKTHSVVAKNVTKEQMWKLFSDVNTWNTWDRETEWTKMTGNFESGNTFLLKPKWGPKVQIEIIECIPYASFTCRSCFPWAQMFVRHALEENKEWLKITTHVSVSWFLGWLWVQIVAKDVTKDMVWDIERQIEVASQL